MPSFYISWPHILRFVLQLFFLVIYIKKGISSYDIGWKFIDYFAFLNIFDCDNFCNGIWETANPGAGVCKAWKHFNLSYVS